jgi:hypothetical protein
MPTTRYSVIAVEQAPFNNLPGGSPIVPAGSILGNRAPQFNDAGLELGDVMEVTAVYQMYGNEVANDIIDIYLAQPNTFVDPSGCKVITTGVATTATLNVGDDDTNGYGYISSGAAFGTTSPAPQTPLQGADPSRYASGINVATGQTNPITFGAAGSSMLDPHIIGTLAVEGAQGGTGAGISGSWIQATFATLATPVAGKCLIFKLKIIKPV